MGRRIIAFAGTVMGMALGVTYRRRLSETDRMLRAHIGLGFAVLALATLQVAAIVLRPKPAAPRRRVPPPLLCLRPPLQFIACSPDLCTPSSQRTAGASCSDLHLPFAGVCQLLWQHSLIPLC